MFLAPRDRPGGHKVEPFEAPGPSPRLIAGAGRAFPRDGVAPTRGHANGQSLAHGYRPLPALRV